MITTQLRNPLFAEHYQAFWQTNENGCTLELQRVPPQPQSHFLDLRLTANLIKALYKKHQSLTIQLSETPPANEVLYWLEYNQAHFPHLRIGALDDDVYSLTDFFANRKQAATLFINQITKGSSELPTLPLCGLLPNQEQEPFYLTDWNAEDIGPLATCIENMYQHWCACQNSLAQNNHTINASNMEDAYRIFWFFEDMNNQNTSHMLAERFILRAYLESQAPKRDVYRLAIRNKNFEVVGGITVNMLPCPDAPLAKQGDIGYFIDPRYAGKRYVSSAMDLLLSFYFKTHDVLSFDIVSTPIGQPIDNLKNNLLSQRAAIHLGAHQSNEAPHEDFTKGGYIPWLLTRESFCANRHEQICRVFGKAPNAPALLLTQIPTGILQTINNNHYFQR